VPIGLGIEFKYLLEAVRYLQSIDCWDLEIVDEE
jgi:hypothetical protein